MDVMFWTILEAVGVCAGAVATTAAVIVALWQSRRATNTRLNISCRSKTSTWITRSNNEEGETVETLSGCAFLEIGITNIGYSNTAIREILITKHGRAKCYSQNINENCAEYTGNDDYVLLSPGQFLNREIAECFVRESIDLNGIFGFWESRSISRRFNMRIFRLIYRVRKNYKVYIVENSGKKHKAKLTKAMQVRLNALVGSSSV